MTPLAKLSDRQLDAFLAENVMGWTWCESYQGYIAPHPWGRHGFHPSTDIAAAWKLIEKLYEKDIHEPEVLRIYGPLHDGYKVEIIWEHYDGPIPIGQVINQSASRAIAEAIATAFGYEEKE